MSINDRLNINVTLNGVKTALTINRSDEEVYRNAEKLFANFLKTYKENYNKLHIERILSLVAYQFAVLLSKQKRYEDISPMEDKIKELNELLKIELKLINNNQTNR